MKKYDVNEALEVLGRDVEIDGKTIIAESGVLGLKKLGALDYLASNGYKVIFNKEEE